MTTFDVQHRDDDGQAAEDPRRDRTEVARRAARFKFAQARVKKIVDGMPPLTDEQLAKLAVLLRSGE